MPIDIFLHACAAVAKVAKYATPESGDTVETVERPRGGFSIVIADGQRSGQSAKAISTLVVQKAMSLLAEGVRDGAAARAAHDALQARRGNVSCELAIASVDLATRTLVVSRNSHVPGMLLSNGELFWLDAASEPIGIHANTKPAITELPLSAGLTLVLCTDGVTAAGCRSGTTLDLPGLVTGFVNAGASPQQTADGILTEVLRLDQNRPHDDASVVVLSVKERDDGISIRRMLVDFPI